MSAPICCPACEAELSFSARALARCRGCGSPLAPDWICLTDSVSLGVLCAAVWIGWIVIAALLSRGRDDARTWLLAAAIVGALPLLSVGVFSFVRRTRLRVGREHVTPPEAVRLAASLLLLVVVVSSAYAAISIIGFRGLAERLGGNGDGSVDVERRGRLPLGVPSTFRAGERPLAFTVRLPPYTWLAVVRGEAEGADLDLHARFGARPVGRQEWDADAVSSASEETLVLSRDRLGGFRKRTLHIQAETSMMYGSGPRSQQPTSAPVSLTIEAVGVESSTPIELGDSHEGRILRDRAGRDDVTVRLPAGTRRVALALADSDVDLDLYARVEPFSRVARATHGSWTVRRDERLTVDVPADTASLHVTVFSKEWLGGDFAYTLHTANDALPASAAPTIAPPGEELDRRLRACVELRSRYMSGSGIAVGGHGYLLTAAHVVRDTTGRPGEALVSVGVSDRDGALPRELLTATVVESRDDLDLALLRVLGSVRPPALALAEAAPETGAPVQTVSFPGIGDGRRATATLATTIVAGRVAAGHVDDGPAELLRLDARTAPGASGGAVLDSEGAVVGIVVQFAHASGAALFVPIEHLPSEWRAVIEGGAR